MSGVPSKVGTKRKISEENRSFQETWEEEFCFISGHKEGTATCLICRDTIVGLKRYNLFRHYTSKHNSFAAAFPFKSEERKEKNCLSKVDNSSSTKRHVGSSWAK